MEDGEGEDGEPVRYRAYGVVVDNQLHWGTRPTYRIVRTEKKGWGQMYGSGVAIESWLLRVEGRTYKRGPKTWWKNKEMEGDETPVQARGCQCNCCVHLKGVEE